MNDYEDDPVVHATELLTKLRSSPTDAVGSPSDAALELGELLGSDAGLCESFLPLVVDLASEPSIKLRRSSVAIVFSIGHNQPRVLPLLLEILLVLTRDGEDGGVSDLVLVGEVARAAQVLLRPLIARILTQPPSAILARAWQNLMDVRGRLEERLLAKGNGLCGTPAFASIVAFMAACILVGTPCILVPPAVPPIPSPAQSLGEASAAPTLSAASRALWELARDFGLDKVPAAHPIIGREACAKDAEKVTRGLLHLLKTCYWDERGPLPEEGIAREGGAPPPSPHFIAATSILIRILTVLAYCRPLLGEAVVAPALVELSHRPPQRLSALSPAGSPTLATPSLQAALLFSLSTLKSVLMGLSASLDSALLQEGLQSPPIPGTVASLASLSPTPEASPLPLHGGGAMAAQSSPLPPPLLELQATAQYQQPNFGGRSGSMLTCGNPGGCLDLGVSSSLPMQDIAELILLNLRTHPLPPSSTLLGGGGGGGALGGLSSLIAEVQVAQGVHQQQQLGHFGSHGSGKNSQQQQQPRHPTLHQPVACASSLKMPWKAEELVSSQETLSFIFSQALERLSNDYCASLWGWAGLSVSGSSSSNVVAGGEASNSIHASMASTDLVSTSGIGKNLSLSHHFGLKGDSLSFLMGSQWSDALDRTLILLTGLPGGEFFGEIAAAEMEMSGGDAVAKKGDSVDLVKIESEAGKEPSNLQPILSVPATVVPSATTSSALVSTTASPLPSLPVQTLLDLIAATPLSATAISHSGVGYTARILSSFSAPLITRLLHLLLLAAAKSRLLPRSMHLQSTTSPVFPLAALSCLLHVAAVVEKAAAAAAAAPSKRRGVAGTSNAMYSNSETTALLARAAKTSLGALLHFFLHCPGLPLPESIALLCQECGTSNPQGVLGSGRMSGASKLISFATGDCLAAAITLRPSVRSIALDALIALACVDHVSESARGKAISELVSIYAAGPSSPSNAGYAPLAAFLKGALLLLFAGCCKKVNDDATEEGAAPSKRVKISHGDAAIDSVDSCLPPLVPPTQTTNSGSILLAAGCATALPVCLKVSRSFSSWTGDYGYPPHTLPVVPGNSDELIPRPPPPPPFASVPIIRLFLKLYTALVAVNTAIIHDLFTLYCDCLGCGTDLGGSLAALITQELVAAVPSLCGAPQSTLPHSAFLASVFSTSSPISRTLLPLAFSMVEATCDNFITQQSIVAGTELALGSAAGEGGGRGGTSGPPPDPLENSSSTLHSLPASKALIEACEMISRKVEPAFPSEMGQSATSTTTSSELVLPAASLMSSTSIISLITRTLSGGVPGNIRYLVKRALKPIAAAANVGGGPPALASHLPSPKDVFQALIQHADIVQSRVHLPSNSRVELLREAGTVAFEERGLFTDKSIREGLVGLVDLSLSSLPPVSSTPKHQKPPIPLLLMLALQLAAAKLPDLRTTVAELLGRILRGLGGGAFEPLGVLEAGGGEALAPVWEGFVRLTKTIVELALPLLTELPPKHLVCLLKRETDLKKRFAAWAAKNGFALPSLE